MNSVLSLLFTLCIIMMVVEVLGGGGDRGGGREAEGDFVLSTMAPFLTLVCFQ